MKYQIEISDVALMHIKTFKKSGQKILLTKIQNLLSELEVHPTTGTGKPEQLKGFETPTWSRRISQQHRLVYQILEKEIIVLVIAAWGGHYEDK